MDPVSVLWVVLAAIAVWLLLDLVVAGGGMTGGMMGGMAGMMGSPVGLVPLLLLVIIGLLVYGFS